MQGQAHRFTLVHQPTSPDLDARLDAIVARQDPEGREGVRRYIEHLAHVGVETVADLQAICADPPAPVDTRVTAIWFLGRLESDPGTLEALVAALGAPERRALLPSPAQ